MASAPAASAAPLRISVTGLDALIRRVGKTIPDAALDAMAEGIYAVGDELAGEAKKRASVCLGVLRALIIVPRPVRVANVVRTRVTAAAPYSAAQEFGRKAGKGLPESAREGIGLWFKRKGIQWYAKRADGTQGKALSPRSMFFLLSRSMKRRARPGRKYLAGALAAERPRMGKVFAAVARAYLQEVLRRGA